MSRAVELVQKWMCEPLTAEEEGELGALLAVGGLEAEEALGLMQVEGMLRGEMLEIDVSGCVVEEIQRHQADQAARQVLGRIGERPRPARRVTQVETGRARSRLRGFVALATAICVLAGISWLYFRSGKPRDQLIAEGTVSIETADGFVEYDGKGGLPMGTKIATAESEGARVVLDDGSNVALGSHTVLAFTREDEAVRVELSEGRIVAQVTKQDANRPFVVRTPNVSVEVVGTRFSVIHEAGLSTVNVEEGAVDVVFSGSGQRRRVAAGEQLTAKASGEPAASDPEDWFEDFEQAELGTWWAVGERIDGSSAPQGNGSAGCLMGAAERDTYYGRDLLVAQMENGVNGLFGCDESLVLSFRYYAAPSCGWLGIWMQTTRGKKYFLPIKATLGSWQTAEVRPMDARSSEGDNDRPMVSGETIEVLKFQAGQTDDEAVFCIDDVRINRAPPASER